MRVLQGITGQAGQPYAISRGLRKRGIDADAVTIQAHKFNYPHDRFIDISAVQSMADMAPVIAEIDRYDVLHFHARSFLYNPRLHSYPSALDLLQLRLLGKKIVFHFRGSELRNRRLFREKNPYHYADNEAASALFDRITDQGKEAVLPFIRAMAHHVLVVDPELKTYAPDATVVERALDENEWPYVGVSDTDEPLIVHAPSRRGVKGTEHILKAVEELKSEGLSFRFQLVEKMPNQEAREIYRRADIIVDQLRIGWYGVLAVEAMALGKVVISYLREDLLNGGELQNAILCANPGTIKETLRQAIENRGMRSDLGRNARAYFEHVHSSAAIAEKLSAIYEGSLAGDDAIDENAVSDFIDYQAETLLAQSTGSKKSAKAPSPLGMSDAVPLVELSSLTRTAVKIERLVREQGTAALCAAVKRRLIGFCRAG